MPWPRFLKLVAFSGERCHELPTKGLLLRRSNKWCRVQRYRPSGEELDFDRLLLPSVHARAEDRQPESRDSAVAGSELNLVLVPVLFARWGSHNSSQRKVREPERASGGRDNSLVFDP